MGRRVCPARAQAVPEEGSRFLNVACQRKTLYYSQCVSQPQTAATESPVGGGTEAPAGVGTRRSPGVLLVSPAGVLVPPAGVRTRTPPGLLLVQIPAGRM